MKAQIELTNACNFNCVGCHRRKAKRQVGYMNFETFAGSLDICEELNIREIWLHNWGESLLHPDIEWFLQHALSRGFINGLTTNGYYLNRLNINKLKVQGLNYLDISFDVSISLHFEDYIKEMYNISVEYGLETSFRAIVRNKKEYDYLLDKIGKYNVKWQRQMLFDPEYERKAQCPIIEKMFVIYWDGTIVPCCQIYDNQIIYDYVFHSNRERMTKVIEYFKEHHLKREICQHCMEVQSEMPVPYKLR